MSEVRKDIAFLDKYIQPEDIGELVFDVEDSFSEHQAETYDVDLSDRVTPYHGVLPHNMEHQSLVGVAHSPPTAFLLKNLYLTSPDELEAKWKRVEALARGRQEALRPTDIIPNFTRERDGKLYEYKFLFAGSDSSGNCVYVFRTEADPRNPDPKDRDDYLVISAHGSTITEPIVHNVTVDPETGVHRLVLHNPKFNPKLDTIPDYRPEDEHAYTTPDGFQRIKLEWQEEALEDGNYSITNAAVEEHTNNGFTRNRYQLRLPTEPSVYEHDRLNPERRVQMELMADLLLYPASADIRDALARLAHSDIGDPVQDIRNRSDPPPGEGYDNVVALAVAPGENFVFSIRTCNYRSDSSIAEHYKIAIVDTNTGDSYRPDVSSVELTKDGRVCLEMQDFDGKEKAYLSWMVGDKGAGYDVTFKRNDEDAGSQLSVIDDLFRMIQRKSGGLSLSEVVEFDRRYEQMAQADKLATRVLSERSVYEFVDMMMEKYIGSGVDDGSEPPELKRTRKRGDGEIEANFQHVIATVVLNQGILSIRSTKDDMDDSDPGDYHIIYGDNERGVLDLPVGWTSSDEKRFRLGFSIPKTNESIVLSCDVQDGQIAPDTWGLEPWGDPLITFSELLNKISEIAGRLVPVDTVDKLGSIAVNDTYSLNA